MWHLVLVFIITLFIYHWWTIRPANFPPGPPCIPLLGSVPFVELNRIHFYMEKARDLYGPIVGLKLAMQNAVFFCAPQQVMEVFKIDAFQGRPQNIAIASNTAKKGLILTEGSFWSTQRRFTLRHLRDFGFGKTSTEGVILEEIEDFFETALYNTNKIQVANLFNTSAINVLWRMMAGKRYQHNDEEFAKLLNALHETFRQGGFTSALVFFRRTFLNAIGRPEKIECEEYMIKFLKNSIEEHKKTRTEEPRDFIDVYLHEIESSQDRDFNEHTLISICLDLFTAGSESTGNTLSYSILYYILYPEIQKEIADEVREVLRGSSPTLSDRSRLPKMEAFLSEVARMNTIAPIPVPRRTLTDVTYQGYFIPKDSFIILSIWSILRDKEHWGDPDVFRPARFLDDQGKYKKDEWLLNFGIGKRQCIGESLAKNVMFLTLVRLTQEFEFNLPEGAEVPSTLGLPGFTSAPQPFEVTLKKRVK